MGCGLAGLTVAIALAKAGHTVEMLEAAPEIAYVGAGEKPTRSDPNFIGRNTDISSFM